MSKIWLRLLCLWLKNKVLDGKRNLDVGYPHGAVARLFCDGLVCRSSGHESGVETSQKCACGVLQ